MKHFFDAFYPDYEQFDDYKESDFHLREKDWAMIGKFAMAAGIMWLVIMGLMRLFGVA